ncbi:MAG: hypothetical protein P8Y77_06205 [Nitrospirota bacterium]
MLTVVPAMRKAVALAPTAAAREPIPPRLEPISTAAASRVRPPRPESSAAMLAAAAA